MTRHSATVDRQVRIELLRARAALEREALAQNLAETGRALEPRNLVRNLLPGKGDTSQWVLQAYNLARRYPIIGSAASALVMGGKRSGLLRWAGLAFTAWQTLRFFQSSRSDRKS